MANEYLQRTPTSSGNRSVFTWSAWVKKTENSGGFGRFFESGAVGNRTYFTYTDLDELRFTEQASNANRDSLVSNYKLRDSSSICHVMIAVNSTLSNGDDRVKMYINGSLINNHGISTNDPPALNALFKHNESGEVQYIGNSANQAADFQGYMSDVFHVDGQELTPEVFGYYKKGTGYLSCGSEQATDYREGQWTPKPPKIIKSIINAKGGFGQNGFYLPMNDSSNPGVDFHCTPNSIVKLKGENFDEYQQPLSGAPETSDAYVSQLRSDPNAANLVLAVPGASTATGANLVTNGTFGTNTTGWTSQDATLSVDSGRIKVLTTNTNYGSALQTVTGLTVGQRYTFQVDMFYGNASMVTAISGASPSINSGWQSADYVWRASFTATTTSLVIDFQMASINAVYGFWDNVVLKQEDTPRDYSADIKGSGTNKTLVPFCASSTNKPKPGVSYNLGGYYGSAMFFTGDAAEFKLPRDDEDLNLGGSDFTIEAWVYPRGFNPNQGDWLGKNGGTGTNSDLEYGFLSDGRAVFYHGDGSTYSRTGQNGITLATGVVPSNQWTHIASVRYGNIWTVYVNGVASGVIEGFLNGKSMPGEADLVIGSDGTSVDTNWHFDGFIQDLRIYKGVAKYKNSFDIAKHYTPIGIETWRTVADTCKNNFATWNPLLGRGRQDQMTYSDGNLKVVSGATGGFDVTAAATMAIKGKIYCEFVLTSSAIGAYVGVMKYDTSLTNNGIDTSGTSDIWLVRGDNGHKANGSTSAYAGGAFSNGDIIMMAVDIANTSIWWGKNGTWFASGNPAANSNAGYTNLPTDIDLLTICGDNYSSETPTIIANFGQNPSFSGTTTSGTNADGNGKGLFKYAPPTGFLALCTDNLPDPVIADPGKYFKTVLYKGNSSSDASARSITGVGFKPDLVWIMPRNNSGNHFNAVVDSVRGPNIIHSTNSANRLESTRTRQLMSFDDDGFTIGDNSDGGSYVNIDYNYVAWCWKAGGPSYKNTKGTLTSQISVNQTAGFSIGTYTGNRTANQSIGHGLGKLPSMIILKERNANSGWSVYNSSRGSTRVSYINITDSEYTETDSTASWALTDPTSDVFYVGNNGATNDNNLIFYAWTEIEGFSKFGSFTGNGNNDGPFVYCGFKPAWVMLKNTNDSSHWCIWDSARQSINEQQDAMRPDAGPFSETNGFQMDFLSNGFKARDNETSVNGDNDTMIFAAFAESPFKTSNAK